MLGVIDIGLDPILIHAGPLAIRWYGLMYVVGIAAGLLVTLPYAASRGIDSERYYSVFWPVVIASLVGGRLYYVAQSNAGWYLRHPARILATWEGGMAFFGAVFGGLVAAYVMARLRAVSFPLVLDVAAVFGPLAQAFGRVGNLVNGDILGYPSHLPWATRYTNPNNTFVPSHVVAYAPAAAYELLFSVALFVLVWMLRYRLRPPGTLFVVWLAVYCAGQFLLFFARANPVVAFGLKQAQLTAVVILIVLVPGYMLWRRSIEGEERQRDALSEERGAVPG